MDPLEIEVKFHISDTEDMRNRIIELGGSSKGRFFETNYRFDDADNRLFNQRALLRLRKDNRTTLTFKSERPDPEHQFKIFRELEVTVNDFSMMQEILKSIGFHPVQIYEKWRETFIVRETILCIDTLPFGEFLEIEGQKKQIRSMAERLSLYWDERILTNYLALFDVIRDRIGLPFADVTFDNFREIEIGPAVFLDGLE